MSLDSRVNFAKVSVSGGYTSSDTVINLDFGSGARLPGSGSYNLVWWNSTDFVSPTDDPNVEIVRVVSRTGDQITVTRGQEGTTASNKNTFGKAYTMILSLTKKMLDDIESYLPVDGTVTLSTGTAQVTFITPQVDTSYRISLTGYADEMFWVDQSTKLTTGFLIRSSNGSSSATVDWTVTR
jgi:hypothetical protein